jgi:hypothetical protein
MTRQRVFIGSSSESLPIARAIQANLERDFEPTVWDQDFLQLTRSTLESLVTTLGESDAGIFVLNADDLTEIRDMQVQTVRDNVLLELGLSIGRLGPQLTFLVTPRGLADLHLPSDLLGINTAGFQPDRADGNWRAALQPACDQIARSLKSARPPAIPLLEDRLIPDLRSFHQMLARTFAGALGESGPGRPGGWTEADNCFTGSIGRTQVRVGYGRIEDCDATDKASVIALPANEFFDDECLNDPNSALGAYFRRALPGRILEVRRLVEAGLRGIPCQPVERAPGDFADSYGVGRSVFLDQPLGSSQSVVLVSTTTQRAGAGLRSEPHFVFAAVRSVAETMRNERLNTVHLPLLGAGHGCIPDELALLYALLALRHVLSEGTDLRLVDIVVFRANEDSEPAISPGQIRKVLALAMTNAR